MLQLVIDECEIYDSAENLFTTLPAVVLQLEHSLISISKWEAKWRKSFLSTKAITAEEFKDYVRCMTINKQVDPSIYDRLTVNHEALIRAYIENPMTATTIWQNDKPSRTKVITSEQIYGWMVGLGIPFECEKWHLNRLMMLIRVCSIQQNGGGKKMSPNERAQWQTAQNLKRRARTGSRG